MANKKLKLEKMKNVTGGTLANINEPRGKSKMAERRREFDEGKNPRSIVAEVEPRLGFFGTKPHDE